MFRNLLAGCALAAGSAGQLAAQPAGPRDTLPTLRIVDSVSRRASRALTGVTPSGIFTGKKADAIAVPALDANTALNSTRQTLGRVPGLMVWEQDAGGLQAGVSVRGLSPNRSWEFNTRQNGADIASDPFGYPEAYYQPPFESLDRIEVVRGAASLQYGPQFGGLLNYVTKRAPTGKPLHVESSQLGGSFGSYSTYTALGTDHAVRGGQVSAYGFLNMRHGHGWRPHAGFDQTTGHLEVALTSRPTVTGQRHQVTLGVTRMDYQLAQPGGLTEAQWRDDPRQTRRTRDWFSAPWTVPTVTYSGWIGPRTAVTLTGFGTLGERNSIGVISSPAVADSGTNARRVDRDRYRNAGGELRVVHAFSVNGRSGALASGLRVSRGFTTRDRGRGPDGGALVLDFTGARTLALSFDTRNVAGFAELSVEVADGVTIAPGVRVEQVQMQAGGTFARASASTFLPVAAPVAVNDRSLERVPLLGLGTSVTRWQRRLGVELYGNVAQAWRPVLFSERFPNDLVAVDPAMRSARGLSADVGARGRALASRLSYDVSVFHLDYDGRVGTLSRAVLGADSLRYPSGLRTNAGRSWHRGFEAFAELDLSAVRRGASLFTSVGRTVATYTRGAAAGRQVEYSPDWVVRSGLTLRGQDARGERWRGTLQGSHVSTVYSDASNTVVQADGLQGIIPAYTVWDLSLSTRLPRLLTRDLRGVRAELNVNNLLDRRYFTRRAAGYPGPGIIPAEPRTVLAGVRVEMGR